MASNEVQLQALINYYAREGYYNHIQQACNDYARKRGGDPFATFWKAFGLAMGGSTAEAIREYQTLKNDRDFQFPSYAGLLHAHEQSKVVDQDAIQEIKAHLTVDEGNATERGLMTASNFYLFAGTYKQSKEYLQKVLHANPNYPGAQTLRGWVELLSGRDSSVQRSINTFDAVLNTGVQDLEAMAGKAKYMQITDRYEECLDMYNYIIANYSWYVPGLAEKARVYISVGKWDEAIDVVERVLALDPYNLDAQLLKIQHKLAVTAQYSKASQEIDLLISTIERSEPRNQALIIKFAAPLARLANRRRDVLELTVGMLEKALKLRPTCAVALEYGYQQTLLGDWSAALAAYEKASRLEEGNPEALYGIIKCQCMDGKIEDAEQQLDYLNELQMTVGKTAQPVFLSAMVAWQQKKDQAQAIKLLDECVAIHYLAMRTIPPGKDPFVIINPDFIMEVVNEYLQHVGTDPSDASDGANPILGKAIDLLETLRSKVPAHLSCLLALAKARYVAGDRTAGTRVLHHCLSLDSTFSEGHVAMAQIYLAQKQISLANQSLEQALSHDFNVRETPLYNLIKARIHIAMGELQTALKILDSTMQLPGIRTAQKRRGGRGRAAEVSLHDRVSVYIALATTYMKVGQEIEGSKIMNDAINEFQGTGEEVRVTIANCEVNLQRGDVEGGLRILRSVQPDNPYYSQARQVMANVYLQYRNDRRSFVKCYEELVEANPTPHTYNLAAEAYMKISEPAKAIKMYQRALEADPQDSSIPCKIGKVLITTHEYQKAIDYYTSAVKRDPSKTQLRHDLADLYTRLRQYEAAEHLLQETLNMKRSSDEITHVIDDVSTLLLLAKVYKQPGREQQYSEALLEAKAKQTQVLSRVRAEKPDELDKQQRQATEICVQIAQYYERVHQVDKAVESYSDALRFDHTSEVALLALAQLHLSRGELNECQRHCLVLLGEQPNHEDATLMLADVMFRWGQYDTATYHFQQLLQNRPDYYTALARLIELLRRAGRLEEAPAFLKLAEFSSPKAQTQAGFHFCKGLYNRYTTVPKDALAEFNLARKDPEWGEKALRHMVEVYLNPDHENLWDDIEGENSTNTDAVRTAQQLIGEMKNKNSIDFRVLECNALLATKSKGNIESARDRLGEILSTGDRDSVPALVALATAYHMLKQSNKSKNFLKRVAKMDYNSTYAEEFERAYLLLAEIFTEQGKYDNAEKLIKTALNHNKSSSKAWEYMGLISEKDQAYRNAAESYERAWTFEHENSPSVGYKLAFNYLKAKRYVEAIDICHKVLKLDPNYPKIRKEILDKARNALRP